VPTSSTLLFFRFTTLTPAQAEASGGRPVLCANGAEVNGAWTQSLTKGTAVTALCKQTSANRPGQRPLYNSHRTLHATHIQRTTTRTAQCTQAQQCQAKKRRFFYSPLRELSEIVNIRKAVQLRTSGHSTVMLLMSKLITSRRVSLPACSDSGPLRKFSERLSWVSSSSLLSACVRQGQEIQ
jgi:hypothetical protein